MTEPPVTSMKATDRYTPEVRAAVVNELGPDGGWLLLSILHYSWRANFDLARSVAPEVMFDDEMHGGADVEFQIVRDLHVQGLLYATAEQFASLVHALKVHDDGGSFFDTYVAQRNLGARIAEVRSLDQDAAYRLLGLPTDAADRFAQMQALPLHDPEQGDRFGDASSVEIGGLLLPRTFVRSQHLDLLAGKIDALATALRVNLDQLGQFVDRPPVNPALGIKAQSLREVDNSFRHGMRVLFHEALPIDRAFGAAGDAERTGTHHVDLYLPRDREDVRFATVECSPDRTEGAVESIRKLSLRMGQLAQTRVMQLLGHSGVGPVVAAIGLTLGGVDGVE